jgi:hypothetical protein
MDSDYKEDYRVRNTTECCVCECLIFAGDEAVKTEHGLRHIDCVDMSNSDSCEYKE